MYNPSALQAGFIVSLIGDMGRAFRVSERYSKGKSFAI